MVQKADLPVWRETVNLHSNWGKELGPQLPTQHTPTFRFLMSSLPTQAVVAFPSSSDSTGIKMFLR